MYYNSREVLMTKKLSPEERKQRAPSMGAVNVRIPPEFLGWLNLQAAEERITVSQVVRDCIAAAIVQSGDAEAFGITIEAES
jgi:predicted HicB family RNase H-like nuclease